jgi:N-hydroxyarylamine O-acetyltransferase
MALARGLTERILTRLGLSQPPECDIAGLRAVYDAWCRRVPFDNVRKRIHIASGLATPLPGDDPTGFFEDWLADGTGGTCWAGNGALAALLVALGFDTRRGVATMLVGPDPTPNHGTVVVRIEGASFVVDASILHVEPLAIGPQPTTIDHPAYGVRMAIEDGERRIHWIPFHMSMVCRLDSVGASEAEFSERHEKSRGWSPFNHSLSARLIRDDTVIGAAGGQLGHIAADGARSLRAFDGDERTRLLIDDLGLSERIVAALPADEPMPPPPSSSR